MLYPAVAEAARRVGTTAIGLIDVGRAAGLNLIVDSVGIRYEHGPFLGRRESPVQRACSVVKRSIVPERALPEVVTRVVVARDPLDVADPAIARQVEAAAPSDRPKRAATVRAEIALAAAVPRALLAGDVVERLPEAVACVPTDALPVVITTWALARYRPAVRLRFWERLGEAAAGRTLAWVSVEGVGVAPNVPTLGDRPASGHSIIGLASYDGSRWEVGALGRCWSRGAMVQWLALI